LAILSRNIKDFKEFFEFIPCQIYLNFDLNCLKDKNNSGTKNNLSTVFQKNIKVKSKQTNKIFYLKIAFSIISYSFFILIFQAWSSKFKAALIVSCA